MSQLDDKTVIYDRHVAFYGGALSNFYPCKINKDGRTYISSEQGFMASKALYFEDENTFNEIMASTTPSQAKKLGRMVKGYNDKAWSKVREGYMYDIVKQKFLQNQKLKEFLLKEDFNNKHFVEGSPIDYIWGVGINYDDECIDKEENWRGINLLGKILDRVREEILNEEN